MGNELRPPVGSPCTWNSGASTSAWASRKRPWNRSLTAAFAVLEGLVIDPSSVKLASDLVELYRQTAPGSCAIRGGSSPSINLDCPLVHSQLCGASRNVALAYRQNGLLAKAAATTRSALEELGCPGELVR